LSAGWLIWSFEEYRGVILSTGAIGWVLPGLNQCHGAGCSETEKRKGKRWTAVYH